MKIIVDAMGGDNAPDAIVEGAITAADKHGTEIMLVGKTEEILRALEKTGRSALPKGVEILNASDTIDMHDDPVTAIREKRDSSMVVALNQLRDGAGDAMVSAGSTGALLSGATLIVKRVRGIRRAALAPVIPGKGKGFLLIDCGANAECTPEYLLQFAYMGSYYCESVMGIDKPRVGLLCNGTEDTKGTQLQLETHRLLREAGDALNFVGNVEGTGIMNGVCDVVVCDGYSGNILLKTIEGVSKFILTEFKEILTKNTRSKLAAVMIKDGLTGLKAKMSSDTVGGTMMLGISKPVIKAHGSSGAAAITAAILQAERAAQSRIAEKLADNIDRMKLG